MSAPPPETPPGEVSPRNPPPQPSGDPGFRVLVAILQDQKPPSHARTRPRAQPNEDDTSPIHPSHPNRPKEQNKEIRTEGQPDPDSPSPFGWGGPKACRGQGSRAGINAGRAVRLVLGAPADLRLHVAYVSLEGQHSLGDAQWVKHCFVHHTSGQPGEAQTATPRTTAKTSPNRAQASRLSIQAAM